MADEIIKQALDCIIDDVTAVHQRAQGLHQRVEQLQKLLEQTQQQHRAELAEARKSQKRQGWTYRELEMSTFRVQKRHVIPASLLMSSMLECLAGVLERWDHSNVDSNNKYPNKNDIACIIVSSIRLACAAGIKDLGQAILDRINIVASGYGFDTIKDDS